MEKDTYLLVNSKLLPPVFSGVIKAKKLLSEGKATNTSQAVKMAGISRSAFYKYRDNVFEFENGNRSTVNLNAVLSDRVGVFSAMTTILYKNGANIITVNQGVPESGTAAVSLTVRTDNVKITLDELINQLKSVEGIISVKSV